MKLVSCLILHYKSNLNLLCIHLCTVLYSILGLDTHNIQVTEEHNKRIENRGNVARKVEKGLQEKVKETKGREGIIRDGQRHEKVEKGLQ